MKFSIFLLGLALVSSAHAQIATGPVPPQAPTPAPTATPIPTHSMIYQSLEQDSPARQAFIQNQNQLTQTSLAASANYIPTQNLIFNLFNPPRLMKIVTLDATHFLRLIERGLGQPTELVLSVTGATDVVLTSNFDIFGVDNANEIIDFNISPDQKLIYIVTEKNGSIDQMSAQVYDFVNRKMLPQIFNLDQNLICWFSNSVLYFNEQLPTHNSQYSLYDFSTQVETPTPDSELIDARLGYAIRYQFGGYFLRDVSTSNETLMLGRLPKQIVNVDANFVYVLMSTANGLNEIRSYQKNSPSFDSGTSIITSNDLSIRSVAVAPNLMFVTVRNGPARTIRVYDNTGTAITTFTVPSTSTFVSGQWVDPVAKNQLKINFTSAINPNLPFVFDLSTQTWETDPNVGMMTLNGVLYSSTVEYATSADGTQIPVRLTSRADIAKDQQNTAVIQSYGGFDLAGYLDPVYDLTRLDFIKRGGLLVGPGLRGGNEYDGTWHTQAMFENKIKTYQDLHATTDLLVREGWTTPSKIVSMGTSNGGLTVAATALLYPNTFGLVIPSGGVHDYLGRDRLDPIAQGWDDEFGSDSNMALLPEMTAISPLENSNAQGTMTAFLILDGKDDTRVNIAHSLKLAAALEGNTDVHASVNLLSVSDAGHAVESSTYSNMKAWKVETAVWTKVYDLAGFTVSE